MTDKTGCIDESAIAEVLELDAAHPLRAHIEECPRCAALVRLYLAFDGKEPVGDDDGSIARKELAGTVAGLAQRAAAERIPAETPRRDRMRGPQSRWSFLVGWKPVLTAAVVVVAAAALWNGFARNSAPQIGDAVRTLAEDRDVVQPHAAQLIGRSQPGEHVSAQLSWHPVVGADGYQIELRDPSLELLATSELLSDTTYVVSEDALPADGPRAFYWRVLVVRNGDEITRSRPMRFDFPPESLDE